MESATAIHSHSVDEVLRSSGAPPLVAEDSIGHGVEPGQNVVRRPELGEPAPGDREDLGRGVLGIGRAGPPQAVGVNGAEVGAVEVFEDDLVAVGAHLASPTACCDSGAPHVTYVPGTSGHSWQAVASTGTSIGFKGAHAASKTLALAAIEILENEELREAAKTEHTEKLGENFHYEPLLGERPPPLDYRE